MLSDPIYIVPVCSVLIPLITAITCFSRVNHNSKILMLLFVYFFFSPLNRWIDTARGKTGSTILISRFLQESVCLNSLVVVILVSIFIYERYKSKGFYSLVRHRILWLRFGLLVYCPATYFYQMVNTKDARYADVWDMHSLVNIFMYALFSIGMFVNIKRTSNP